MKALILPNGEKLYYIDKLSALDMYEEIYLDDDYFQYGIDIKDNELIFDVGANIGLIFRYGSQKAQNLKISFFKKKDIGDIEGYRI